MSGILTAEQIERLRTSDSTLDAWLQLRASHETLGAERDRLVTMLADCYRQTGADPDGNDDRMLAEHAVNAVRELRADLDSERKCADTLLEEKRGANEDWRPLKKL